MKRLNGNQVRSEVLDEHTHVCDLVNFDYPVVQLCTDGRRNWIYLWCDNAIAGTNRWLVFTVSRALLVAYLQKKTPMLELVKKSDRLLLLDTNAPFDNPSTSSQRRLSRRVVSVKLDAIDEYLPAADSYFDESFTSDLDLTKELTPTTYPLPITGTWFGHDFQNLFKRYERLYAFFYATRPRFVRTLGDTLDRVMRAPWKGGFSRVNLYSQLAKQLPALHSLKVAKIAYASPGNVEFEAISSIGTSIQNATNLLLANEELISEKCKSIQKILIEAKLNREDLSLKSDAEIRLTDEQRLNLRQACTDIASLLSVDVELGSLRSHAPNVVVLAKAVVSFTRQLSRLAELRKQEMLAF